MKTVEPTLKERAGRMYRQLLILQRLFQRSREADDVEWVAAGDRSRDVALCEAVFRGATEHRVTTLGEVEA